jgi:hypothetical protein
MLLALRVLRPPQKGFLKHKVDAGRFAIVAVHKGDTIPTGTLTKILRTAKISVDELRLYL